MLHVVYFNFDESRRSGLVVKADAAASASVVDVTGNWGIP